MLFSAIVNRKLAKFIPLACKTRTFIDILCAFLESRAEIFCTFTGLQDETSILYSCDISFANFVYMACIRVLVRLRYVSSFLGAFQP